MQRKLVVIADKNVQTGVDPEIDPLALASNIGIKVSEVLVSMINLCDHQYLRLESILTKPWTK